MEIKTCEEYVLYKLSETENRLCNFIDELTETRNRLVKLEEDYNKLKKLFVDLSVVTESGFGGKYISFRGIIEEYDENNYEIITSLLPEILNSKE